MNEISILIVGLILLINMSRYNRKRLVCCRFDALNRPIAVFKKKRKITTYTKHGKDWCQNLSSDRAIILRRCSFEESLHISKQVSKFKE